MLIHLLISTSAMGQVIDSMTGQAVLLLGRFTPERIEVLSAVAARLRSLGDLPIIFNFDKPADRSISETVLILAGLSKFVIADLTNPKSSPYEAPRTPSSGFRSRPRPAGPTGPSASRPARKHF